jgi:hypothetical protein
MAAIAIARANKKQMRGAANEDLANQLATLRKEIEARNAMNPGGPAYPSTINPALVNAMAVTLNQNQMAPLGGDETRSMIGDNLRKRPQDYKNLTPYMRSLYNAAARRAGMPSAPDSPYADTQGDIDRKARMGKMAMVGPGASATGKMQAIDTTDQTPANQKALAAAVATAKQMENARFSEGSAYQQAVRRRRELAAAAQGQNYAKNMQLAYRRGVLRPGAVDIGVEQKILPDLQGKAAERAIAMIQAQHPRRAGGELDAALAERVRGSDEFARGAFKMEPVNPPNGQLGQAPAGGPVPQPGMGQPGHAAAFGGKLIGSRPDGLDVYQMPDGTQRMERRRREPRREHLGDQ